MSFEAAEYYGRFIALFADLLLLSLPFAALASIWRRRRNRPGASLLFQLLVLGSWLALLLFTVVGFLTGSWYGENGPTPQMALLWTAALVIGLVALHVMLFVTSSRPNRGHVGKRV